MNSQIDTVFIRNLTFDTIIGILPAERITAQPICINIAVTVNIRAAAKSQSLADTLDYAALAGKIESYTKTEKFLLVEALAEGIAHITLQEPLAEAVEVEVNKPNALSKADGVGVQIYRTNSER